MRRKVLEGDDSTGRPPRSEILRSGGRNCRRRALYRFALRVPRRSFAQRFLCASAILSRPSGDMVRFGLAVSSGAGELFAADGFALLLPGGLPRLATSLASMDGVTTPGPVSCCG